MSNIVKCCVKQAFKILTTVCSNITNLRTGDTSLRSMLYMEKYPMEANYSLHKALLHRTLPQQ